ncbi:MucBP domain-containing protein [Carnobacterium gallinarum]|uniref:MucBP domain-containing protein n=1 Tax=Carnobacterium gallinarum TaxID=2749 RepID=UPI0006899537|nr:MucBP domain-containing protein [Carnobacterium gallinarum]
MRGNLLKKILILVAMFLFFISFSIIKVSAAEENSTVTTHYVLFDDLSKSEQQTIVKEQPKVSILYDKENFKLVYQKISTISGVSSPTSPIKSSYTSNSVTNSGGELPKAGETVTKPLFLTVGIVLVLITFGLLIWKRKQMKTMLVLFILAGGVGVASTVSAAESSLPNPTTQTLTKGNSIFSVDTTVSGYKYIGYIHNSSNDGQNSNTGTVTVKYQDDATGKAIAEDATLAGAIGAGYKSEQKTIAGYTFKEVVGTPSGMYTAAPQTVTYAYTKNVEIGTVTVKYQDEDGKTIAEDMTLTGNVGETYKAEQKTIAGYTFKEVVGTPSGMYTAAPQTVTYTYTKNVEVGTVTVKYQDEDGKTIAEDMTLTGNVGETYKAEQKTIAGYTDKEVVGNASGTFTTTAQTVTFVYAEDSEDIQSGTVTVKYQDDAGKTIAADTILTGNVGDAYTTEQKTIAGYTYKEVVGNASGTFASTAQTVSYVYVKDVQKGIVTANYQDTAGNTIAENVQLTGNIGEAYTTEQKTIAGYTFKEVVGNASGTFASTAQTVSYVYVKDIQKGTVIVKYQDAAGNTIAGDTTLTDKVGTLYTTEQKTITGYTFKEVIGNVSGTFTPEVQTVTYVYIKDIQTGIVTVSYQDTAGNTLEADAQLTGNVGSTYIAEQKTIPGYTFKEAIGNIAGTFTPEMQNVKFVYVKDTQKGTVIASYQDEAGNSIAEDVQLIGNSGDAYTTQQKIIAGYTFKEVIGNASGTFTPAVQTVTYVYVKDAQKGTVTVNYQDEAGNTLEANVLLTGNVGDAYTTEQKTIAGYTFKEVVGNTSGTFAPTAQTVTYIYVKDVQKGTVTVSYQDTAGNALEADVLLTGNVGDAYTTEQKTIAGYTFKEVVGNATGTFATTAQTVTYVYTKDVQKGTVTVKYQDAAGNELTADVLLTGNVGDAYTAEQKTIDGYTFKEVQGDAVGEFANGNKVVIFTYDKQIQAATITLQQSGFIDATNRGYIKPNFYKVTYYDLNGNIMKTEEINKDTTLVNETITSTVGDSYKVYSKVTYECYSVVTGERLIWGDYQLVANNPALTEGVLTGTTLTIEYTFKDLSWQ